MSYNLTEKWGDLFQELATRGGLFWNDVGLASGLALASVSFSTFPFWFETLFMKK